MEDNGFDLDNILEGLQEIAMIYKTDIAFKEIVKNTYKHLIINYL